MDPGNMSLNANEANYNDTDSSVILSLMRSLTGSVLSKLILILYPVISVWIIVVNVFTLLVYAKFKQLQTKRNVMIISLSAVDLFAGLTQILPKAIGRLLGADNSFGLCMAANVLHIAPSWASILHLVTIAIERHIAITKPLLYHVIVTPSRLAFAVAGNVTVSLFISLMALAWPRERFSRLCMSILWYPKAYSYGFLLVTMSTAIAVILLLYVHIYTIARRQERAIASETATRGYLGQSSSGVHKESHATQVFMFICGIALACFIPMITAMALLTAMPNQPVIIYYYYLSAFCQHCNSGMNFLVYTFRNNEFRTKLKLLFHCSER